ncbi:MAG: hypothetical protein M3324_05995 [Actinomycetota bacterium]|nr:hypothetical protein [Actinomycetota bacterium]
MVALLVVLSQASWACSGDPGRETGGGSKQSSSNFEEGTLASTKTVQEETTASSPPPEATLGAGPDSPGVVLRLEGDPKTTFSGLCAVGGEESVLSGRVPKRYAFNLDGKKLTCRIQKQDSGRGDLKVILTADDTTRSVQQTSSREGFINISYQGG